MGVLYDLSFSNQVTWRSQQRDFDYFLTDQFCFPCYNSDCSFITSTTLASMRISSEIYTSLIPIGAIVIQKSNQSDCYDGSASALRRSSTNQMLKLYPKAACSYVFSDCVMKKYVEEKYRDTLISSESTDVSLLEWNQFKIPVVDQYGSYFQILQTKTVDLNDGLLYSIFRIYYSCSKLKWSTQCEQISSLLMTTLTLDLVQLQQLNISTLVIKCRQLIQIFYLSKYLRLLFRFNSQTNYQMKLRTYLIFV
ncbi:Conserved_hypothetical protein [Hexamita inflata]|uniref:Uncharacterized protein n=1 Tax=Hexamita inflata TaxID=28002 RepID=A0AA86TR08_9EUKA|nr:Conserved hypothetical protein [Hexamita inflata]